MNNLLDYFIIMCLTIIVGTSTLCCTVAPADPPTLKEFKIELYSGEKVIRTWVVDGNHYPKIWRSTTNVGFTEKETNKSIEIVDIPEGVIIISEI